jgi:hypothetical protein
MEPIVDFLITIGVAVFGIIVIAVAVCIVILAVYILYILLQITISAIKSLIGTF